MIGKRNLVKLLNSKICNVKMKDCEYYKRGNSESLNYTTYDDQDYPTLHTIFARYVSGRYSVRYWFDSFEVSSRAEILDLNILDQQKEIDALPFQDEVQGADQKENIEIKILDDDELLDIFYDKWTRLESNKNLKNMFFLGCRPFMNIGQVMFYSDGFDYYIYTPDCKDEFI